MNALASKKMPRERGRKREKCNSFTIPNVFMMSVPEEERERERQNLRISIYHTNIFKRKQRSGQNKKNKTKNSEYSPFFLFIEN